MVNGRIPETYAKIRVPNWLFGGSPMGLLQYSRLHSKPVVGEEGVWAVQPEEVHLRRRAELIRVHHLAGPLLDGPRFHELIPTGPKLLRYIPEEGIETVNRLGERALNSGSLVNALSHAQLSILVSPDRELAEMAEHHFNEIRKIGMEGDSDQRPLDHASAHVIWRDEVLLHRLKFASVWLRFEHDDQFRAQGPGYLQQQFAGGEQIFASSSSLYSGVYVFDAYLSPLLACLSPWVWGFYTAHAFGNYIQTYGATLNGVEGVASELLQTVNVEGGLDPVARPILTARSSSLAVEWWARRLNELFTTLSDFSYFVDADGFYNASAHTHALASVEQLFRRTASMQVAHRDAHARRVLLFTILDTLQRLTRRNLETHCSLRFARKTLDGLKAAIPDEAAEVLLPRAISAVDALERMQAGFFLSRGQSGVSLPDGNGGHRLMSFDTAVAQYTKVLRDATHGHGTNRAGNAMRTNALLAHHDGDVPHSLGWLGYLYLLDFLAKPETFRDVLRSDSMRPS